PAYAVPVSSLLPSLLILPSSLAPPPSSPSLFHFFFQCPADHRDLHSFPTRRSSDLRARRRRGRRSRRPSSRTPGRGAAPRGSSRSEEHTSELQSRFDLVCRLLLEKKKKNIVLS